MSISDRLAAITARAESVMTPAPWTSHTYPDGGGRVYGADGYELPGCFNCGSNDDAIYEDGDAEFIAAARSDVPWLVEQVRKRDEAIQAVLDVCEGLEEAHRANPTQSYEYGLEEAAHRVRNAIAAALGGGGQR